MKVMSISIQDEQMTVEFDQINSQENLSFVLRHRKTKDVIQVNGLQDNANNKLTLEYKNVDLPETDFARYDLLVATEEKLIRPQIENKKVSLKKVNSDVFYFTDQQDGFRFYFTRDNEISVIRGNYLNVEKEFKQLRKIDIPVVDSSFVAGKLSLETLFQIPNENTFIAWKNEKGKYILNEDTYIQQDGNNSRIEISKSAFDAVVNLEQITPSVFFVKDNILYEGILKSKVKALDNQIGNTVNVYYYSENGKFQLTNNLNLFMRKILNIGKKKRFVKDLSFTTDLITVELESPENLEDISLFKENVKNKSFTLVNDFKVTKSTIQIPTDMVVDKQEQYRYVFLKKGAENSYKYYGFFKRNFSKQTPKSQKYNGHIPVDDNLWLCSYWSVNGELIFRTATPEKYREARFEEQKVDFSGSNFVDSFAQIKFQLDSIKLSTVKDLDFYLIERKTKKRFDLDFKIEGKDTVILDFSSFIAELETVSSRWDTFVDVYQQESYLHGKLVLFTSSVQNKFARYRSTISGEPNDAHFCLVPYFSVKNELAFIWNNIDNIHNEQVQHDTKVSESKVNGKSIEVVVEITKIDVSDFKVTSGLMKLRNKAVMMSYEIPAEVISQTADKVVTRLIIEPEKYHMLPFFWDLFVELEINGEKYPIRVKKPTKDLKKRIMKQINRNEIDLADSYMIYPYVTTDNSYALCYRERNSYENKTNRIKENLAYLTYRLFKKHFDKKKIWIGYEKNASVAQDNGYQFFNYCYNNNKKKDYYFVIKTDSVDYQDIRHQDDKILKFMSFKYMVYMFAAELMISSESTGHSYDIRIQKGHLRDALKKKKFIFLQHGVTALKRVDYVFKKGKNNVSLFTATSDFEKNIIKNNFGYDVSEIMLTGFTRWDVLKDKSTQEDKKIFVMPTWRSWMDGIPEEEFVESDYYKQYRKLLESKELNSILEKNNITLHFLLHPKFIDYSDKFTIAGDRIQTHQFGEIKINEMLMESNLLITDYSSVSWEFFYMKKPVLFFQFDQDDYDRYQGSYIDLKTGLFGDSANNVDELLKYVKEYVNNDFKEKPEFAVLRNKYFKYVDHNNSKRTFEAISKFEKKLK